MSQSFSMMALGAAILTTTAGQGFYKAYHFHRRSLFLVLAVGFFIITPLFAFLALRGLGIDTVYMSTALTHVLILLVAHHCFSEVISRTRWVGVSLVLLGLVVFNLPQGII